MQTIANYLNALVEIAYLFNAIFNLGLALSLFYCIKKMGLFKKYGLCKSSVKAKHYLFYIPLVILVTHNLWNGVALNFNALETTCYLVYMLFVGIVEEILFRGLLFKVLEKDNLVTAIIISSVTFGLGHILHLVDGSGAELVENICQVIGAIAVGFLFVVIFYRGGSLIPCIITHSAIDMASTFANQVGLTTEKRIILCAIKFAIVVVYTLVLLKTLPKKQDITNNAPQEV